MAEPTPEMLARMVAFDVYDYSGGTPGQWVLLHTVARRLELFDRVLIDIAARWARDLGWLTLEPANEPYHAQMTDAGLQMFKLSSRHSAPRVPREGGRGSLAKPGAQRALQRNLRRLGRRRPPAVA
jgi:hypothetical protein